MYVGYGFNDDDRIYRHLYYMFAAALRTRTRTRHLVTALAWPAIVTESGDP